MTKRIVVADLYGLGGLTTSPGMLTLAQKIRALGPEFIVLGPYDQSDWNQAAIDLNAHQTGDNVIAAVGYSLGANNIVLMETALGRSFRYLAGIQPSFWGQGATWSGVIQIAERVGKAVCIYNPCFICTGGLGYARYSAPAKLIQTTDLHPQVDNDPAEWAIILNDLKALAA